MKIKIMKSIASRDYSYARGDTVDLPTEQANQFVSVGIAEAVATKKSAQKKVDKDADNS